MTLDATIREELDKPLDPARKKQRQGAGRRSLDYLETHDVIRHANRIFGYGEWGFTTELVLLGEEPVEKNTREGLKEGFRVGYRATVTVIVAGCEPTCGVGYGDAVEYTGSRITPHELAAKEAESDALKRALKNYGDQFGLGLYAKGGGAQTGTQPAAAATFTPPTTNRGDTSPATAASRANLKVLAERVVAAGLTTQAQLDNAVQILLKKDDATFKGSLPTFTVAQAADLTGRLERFEENARKAVA